MSTPTSDALLRTKGVSLERMHAFLAVYEAGGIARAAPGEPVRQSQLSRQVSELEAALGCALFTRAGRTLAPTVAAASLSRVVRELIAGLAAVAGERERAVRFTLGAGGSVLHWLALPALAAVRTAADAGVEVEVVALSSEDVVDHLVDGRIDVGVLRADTLPARASAVDLVVTRIGTVSYAWFASKRLAARAPEAGDTARLASLAPLVAINGEPRLTPMFAQLAGGRAPGLVCETFVQAAAAIRSGAFAGLLPSFAQVSLPSSEFHVRVPAGLARFRAPLLLASRKRMDAVEPRMRAVRTALAAEMRARLARG